MKVRRSQELQTANSKMEIANNYTKENKNTLKQTTKAENLNVKPRRSPRNHLISSTRLEPNKENENQFSKTKENLNQSYKEHDLFMADDSFELNSGITNALAAVDKLKTPPNIKVLNENNDDEIPSSQHATEEIASTPNVASSTAHTSRFMRSALRTQKLLATQRKQQQRQMTEPNESPPPVIAKTPQANSSNSLDLSNFSLDNNSLIKNPIQLNASHILSCSKLDTNASSFKSIEIIDICGNEKLFKEAFKELMKAKRFGFSLGLQKQENKRRPLIGANLLINQVASSDLATPSESLLFQIDNDQYLAGVAFSIADNIVYFMNMQESEEQCRNAKGLTAELKCKYLRMILCCAEHTLLVFDAKEQLKLLCKALPDLNDISVKLEDPKVANWLLQPDKMLSYQLMSHQFAPECSALVNLCGSGRGYNSFGLDANSAILAKVRCSIEACVNVHILKGQIENLERIGTGQLLKFFKELEMPLQLSLCNMEKIGFPTSEAALRKLFQQMMETMKKLEIKIYEMHGSRFNLGSSTAVAKVLGLHRKANGRIITSRQILEKIDSPISQLIVTYRKLSVTLAKNIQPLLKCVQNDRIHGHSITYTATGRISMSEPNLQNVAKDFDVNLSAASSEQVKISCRSAFFPVDKKFCLISADFCQLEMRILAHLSQDAALLQAMNSKIDIFTAIAARWYKIVAENVSEQLRNGTKQICYGIVYGMGMRSLAEALKCTEQEAKLVTEQFHAAYAGIRTYADKVIKFARQNGYIETITGRRRYLENIQSGEPQMKTQAERQAINSTIQGSAADIAKNAILRMEKNIMKYRDKLGIDEFTVRLVLHLHDELIFEVPEEKAKKIAKVLSLTMENCVKLSVPLKVKLKMGHSWGELKEIKL